MSEKFCLKWNDYDNNLSSSFKELRKDQHLCDVTLVTDDYQQLAAHKIVLSLSSEYFQSLFKSNSNGQNMLICLEGVTRQDVNNCIDYMYNGEVQISQDDLDRFLNVAQRFKIKGLLSTDEKYSDQTINDSFKKENLIGGEDIEHGQVYTQEHNTPLETNSHKKVISLYNNDISINKYENIESLEDGSLKCTVCGKISSNKRKDIIMQQHAQTHIKGLSFTCPVCYKSFRSKHSLSNHKSTFHKQ